MHHTRYSLTSLQLIHVVQYPFHILNLASIHDLSSRLPPNFGERNALRFRANIYVTGPEAYAEDDWKRIRIGNSIYLVTHRTSRCNLPYVDPLTGTMPFGEPFNTMTKYRKIDDGSPSPCLGMQMVPQEPEEREIRVGGNIEVLETGKHFFIK